MADQRAHAIERIIAVVEEGRARGERISIDDAIDAAGTLPDQSRDELRSKAISRLAENTHASHDNDDTSWPAIDGYDIVDAVGRGGMGAVFEAYQQSTGRRVALKIMIDAPHAIARSAVARRRFEREVELVARLEHPGVVSVIDAEVDATPPYLVMEFVDGTTLDESIEPGVAHPDRIIDVLIELCDAVAYAHERGILHRDLKPSNILVDPAGRIRVVDFGLAKTIEDETHARLETLSQPGQLIGTLAYMAPEQARGDVHAISARTDIYAIGAIAYELVTGNLPHPVGGSLATVLSSIENDDPARPSASRHAISRDFDAIIQMALAKDPERRYETAAALREDLQRLKTNRPTRARPIGFVERTSKWIRRNRTVATVAGAASIAIIATTGASIWRITTERDRAIANEQVARDKLDFSLDAFDRMIFEQLDVLKRLPGTEQLRRDLTDKSLAFFEELPDDAATLGLEARLGPQLGKLGDLLHERGEHERADWYYQRSAEITSSTLDNAPDDPTHLRDAAFAQQRLAQLADGPAERLTSLTAAEALFERAILPDDWNATTELAACRVLMARAAMRADQPERALSLATSAYNGLLNTATNNPHEPGAQDKLIDHLTGCIYLALNLDRIDLAQAWATQAAERLDHAASDHPGDSRLAHARARALVLKAETFDKAGELDTAETILQGAADHARQLLLAKPYDVFYRLSAADAHRALGDLALRRKKTDDSLDAYEQSMTIVRTLYETNPTNRAYERRYVDLHLVSAHLANGSGRTDDAIRLYSTYSELTDGKPEQRPDLASMRAYAMYVVADTTDNETERNTIATRAINELDWLAEKRELIPPEARLRDSLIQLIRPSGD